MGSFLKTLKLNLFQLNFKFSHEPLNFIGEFEDRFRSGLIYRFFNYFRIMLVSLFQGELFNLLEKNAHEKIFVFATTANQYDSLKYLDDSLGNSALYSVFPVKQGSPWPRFWTYILSLPFFPLVVLNYFRSSGYKKKSFSYCLDQYWLTYGTYLFFRWYFRWNPFKAVVVSNDHIFLCRCCSLAASDEGIKTVYVQHASVLRDFPELTYDIALLEGRDSFEKYDRPSPNNTNCFLVGSPKYDRIKKDQLNEKERIDHIGICANKFDDFSDVESLVKKIKEHFDFKLSLRPHPADMRGEGFLQLCNQLGVNYSSPSSEGAIDFLKKQDAIIASETNIHLEAILLNVYPLYYVEKRPITDQYEFIKNGVVTHVSKNLDELIVHLNELKNNRPHVRQRAQYYNALIGTLHEGQSADICGEVINFDSKENLVHDNSWTEKTGKHLKCFEKK